MSTTAIITFVLIGLALIGWGIVGHGGTLLRTLAIGFGVVIFFVATAWLLSREYFDLAAMRFRPPDEAKAFRKHHAGTVFIAGLLIAGFVSIPIVNLATPLFAMSLMVHVHKRLGRRTALARTAA